MHASDFYPRPPRGGRRQRQGQSPYFLAISTHALHEEGDLSARFVSDVDKISTHALHEEGDVAKYNLTEEKQRISTHALHEEGDQGLNGILRESPHDFYPRPPRGGRLTKCLKNTVL